jgi:hypothetical protein
MHNLSTCAGTAKVVLFPHQALTQPQAAAFCQAQLGPGAALVNGNRAVLAAAQGLVQSANVSVNCYSCCWPACHAACALLLPLVGIDSTVHPTPPRPVCS